MKVMYDPAQLRETAFFILRNNPAITKVTPESIMAQVLPKLKNPEINMISSGGWNCSISQEQDTIYLEFLVDPRVGLDSNYIVAEVI